MVKDAIYNQAPYSVKVDEDCFVSEHVWNYIYDNIDVCLMDRKALLIAPLLSTGIPTCTFFVLGLLNEKEREELFNIYLKREMPNNLWKLDYSILNKHTIYAEDWIEWMFYDSVRKLETNFKGIHPLRISYKAHIYLNEWILKNYDKVFHLTDGDNNLCAREASNLMPYFTNSFFAIRTSEWKHIITNETFQDRYDNRGKVFPFLVEKRCRRLIDDIKDFI